MKKIIICVTIVVMLVCASCATTTTAAKPGAAEFAAFNAVIEKSYNNISSRLKSGMRIAILPIRAADKDKGDYAFDTMDKMFNNANSFNMITRSEIAAIIKEQNFQYSGMVDDNTAASLGKLLGAQAIIIGDIAGADYTRRLVFRCLDVETGRILAISSETF